MIIDDRTNSHLDQIQDRLDDPLDSQDELIKLIKSIHEVSFNIPYTFLNTALVHLLAESDKKKQLLDSAKYLKNPDNLN